MHSMREKHAPFLATIVQVSEQAWSAEGSVTWAQISNWISNDLGILLIHKHVMSTKSPFFRCDSKYLQRTLDDFKWAALVYVQ